MDYSIHPNELFQLLTKAAELGANRALIEMGAKKPLITKQAAYKMYNRVAVDRAIKCGEMKTVKKGGSTSTIYIVRSAFETWMLENELYSKPINSK